jgi:hypothetical protein
MLKCHLSVRKKLTSTHKHRGTEKKQKLEAANTTEKETKIGSRIILILLYHQRLTYVLG